MRDLASLTAADFQPAIGTVFEVDRGGADALPIQLTEVVAFGERPGYRPPFALRFEGPNSPVLAQATRRIVHPDLGELELFLGPVQSASDGVTYEAVFG
jgi:hypothetical protein